MIRFHSTLSNKPLAAQFQSQPIRAKESNKANTVVTQAQYNQDLGKFRALLNASTPLIKYSNYKDQITLLNTIAAEAKLPSSKIQPAKSGTVVFTKGQQGEDLLESLSPHYKLPPKDNLQKVIDYYKETRVIQN